MPNEWQELDEEEESDGGQELLSTYGPFSVILYARVKKLKLFDIGEPGAFLERFVDFYIRNAKEMGNKGTALKSVQTLVSLFPSPRRFTKLLHFHRLRGRDMVFFKVALDIMTFYYKETESPLFSRLQNEIIPLALQFYRSLSPQTIKDVSSELMSCINKSEKPMRPHIEDKTWLVLCKSRGEYLRHYRSELIQFQNLTAGNDLQTYLV